MANDLVYLWDKESSMNNGFRPSVKCFRVSGSRGAVLVIPGGAYTHRASHEGDPVASMINTASISAFVLDYHVCPCKKDEPLQDALRAVRIIRSMGYEKVSVLGFSAGGNLACCAAVHYADASLIPSDPVDTFSSRPDGLISCYSVVSMLENVHFGSVRNLLQSEWEDMALRRYFSAEVFVDAFSPPAFIWHTSCDSSVPPENSLRLAQAYAAHGIDYELHIFPGGHHGMGLAKEDKCISQWTDLCLGWLKRNGF